MSAAAEFTYLLNSSKTEPAADLEKAPLGIATCQRGGKIIALTPALERMFGGVPELRPESLKDLLDPRDRGTGEHLLEELFEGRRESFQIESLSAAMGGRIVRWTAWRASEPSGAADHALAVAEVATARTAAPTKGPTLVEAEQRLRQAERLEAVGRLAGGVAHDFNNLLTGVLLYCDLLLAHLEPCHRVRKYAVEIRNAGIQATGLVRQLLAVARPRSSEPELLSLNQMVEGMQSLLRRLIGENIELQFQLDPNLGLIRMDPTQVQQILLNLVLNARDAMPGGGRIAIKSGNGKVQVLAESGIPTQPPALLPTVVLMVEDNGSGMDEATRARVFEPFFTTKSGKGTGLGLATVRDIVSSNGGLIYVDSALDRGTRFTVLLPMVSVPGPANPVAGSAQSFATKPNEGVTPARQEE